MPIQAVYQDQPMILMLSGWPGSGKSAVADSFCQQFGMDILKPSRLVQNILRQLNKETDDLIAQHGEDRFKAAGGRELLEYVSNLLADVLGPKYLMAAMKEDLRSSIEDLGESIVIDGLRRPEEIQAGYEIAAALGVPAFHVRVDKAGLGSPTSQLEHQADQVAWDCRIYVQDWAHIPHLVECAWKGLRQQVRQPQPSTFTLMIYKAGVS